MSGELVLVTGGSGYLGAHCILALLHEGYRVRTTVRSRKNEAKVRAMVQAGGIPSAPDLSFIEADLASDAGWAEAAAGCRYVLHVASPFPLGAPRDENELILPAREGTLRVLRAARDAGVQRVVLTSSSEAVVHGPKPEGRLYTEEQWSDTSRGMTAYGKSKTLAERAAWEFMTKEGGRMELTVVNPVGIFGPVLGPDLSTSVEIISQMLLGKMPRLPRLTFDLVDVRDLARLQLLAMVHPSAGAQRFLATAGSLSLQEIAVLLKSRLGTSATLISTKTIPDVILRLAALLVPELRQVVPFLGQLFTTTSAKARQVLGWQPRPMDETLLATAESLILQAGTGTEIKGVARREDRAIGG
jgi:nucleoside-diphosphate-sugar epimerase